MDKEQQIEELKQEINNIKEAYNHMVDIVKDLVQANLQHGWCHRAKIPTKLPTH